MVTVHVSKQDEVVDIWSLLLFHFELPNVYMPGADVCVYIACPQNVSLPHGYRELTMPCTPAEESLGNARIDAATMVTVLTKRRRNSGCVVAALPPELLSYVISMNVLSDRPGHMNGKYGLGWISATQVCHRWREIALATPTLWRYLDFTCMPRRWCSEMLRRSGNCSLEVALRIANSPGLCPIPTSFDAARELMRPEYSARLAGLRLDLSSRIKRDIRSLIHSLQQSSPRLEYLALQRTSWELVTISSFTSRMPSLRRLRLSNVSLSPWVSPVFTSLQELDISFDPHRLPRSHDSLLSFGEMSTILCRMPELQRLALRNVFLEGTRVDGMPNGRISLPNLRQLSLIDQQGCDLFSFAASLCLPPETCAEIKTNGRAWVDSLLPTVRTHFRPYPEVEVVGERIPASLPRVSRIGRAHGRTLCPLAAAPRLFPTTHRVTATSSSSTRRRISTFPSQTNSAPFQHGTALHLDGLLYLDIASHVPWPADCWRALFAHATRLRQVRAMYRGAVDGLILQVLLAVDNHDEESRMLPSLRSVKLSLVDLDEAVDAGRPTASARGSAPGRPRATQRHPRKRNTGTRGSR
ncbi:hypothetical protein BJY52DRAFT_1215149 [Lactarius psammicola]|nr:hypothetical protein BJY52DRAFT_1215149 [Lactarius psammicola]